MPINKEIIIALRLQDDLTAKFGRAITNINKELTSVQNISNKLGNTDLNKGIEGISKGMKDLDSIKTELGANRNKIDFGAREQAKELDSVSSKYSNLKDKHTDLKDAYKESRKEAGLFNKAAEAYHSTFKNKDVGFEQGKGVGDYLDFKAKNYEDVPISDWKRSDKGWDLSSEDYKNWRGDSDTSKIFGKSELDNMDKVHGKFVEVDAAKNKLYDDLANKKPFVDFKSYGTKPIENGLQYLNTRASNWDNLSKDQWKELDNVYKPTQLDFMKWERHGGFPDTNLFSEFQKQFGFEGRNVGQISQDLMGGDGTAKDKEAADLGIKFANTPIQDVVHPDENPSLDKYKQTKEEIKESKKDLKLEFPNGYTPEHRNYDSAAYDDKLSDLKEKYGSLDDVSSKSKESKTESTKPSDSNLIDDYRKTKTDVEKGKEETKSALDKASTKSVTEDLSKAQTKLGDFKTGVTEVNKNINDSSNLTKEVNKATVDTSKNITKVGETSAKTASQNNKAIDSTKTTAENTAKTLDENSKAAANVSKNLGGVSSNFDVLAQRGSRAGKNISSHLNDLEQNFTTLSGSLNGFLGLLGMGTIFSEIWSATTIREGNKIMLSQKRNAEEVSKIYDVIQRKVLELPGDDTFFTNLATMASTMDTTLTEEGIGDLTETIANYYALAKAKGENDYETQKDIRSYILSGNTRNFLNSAISTEISTLKNKNSITERSIALQKAMQNANVDGMAKYSSLTNIFETFKGHFQKAFADVGDNGLIFIKTLLQLYNTIDDLLNTGLSQFLITVSVLFLGGVGGVFAFKKGIELTISSVNSLVRLSTNVTSFIASIGLGASRGAAGLNSLSNSMKGLLLTSSLTDSHGLLSFLTHDKLLGSRSSTQTITRLKKEMMDLGNVNSDALFAAESTLQSRGRFNYVKDGKMNYGADYTNLSHRKYILARSMAQTDALNDPNYRMMKAERRELYLNRKEKKYAVQVEKQLATADAWRSKSLIAKIGLIGSEIKATILATASDVKNMGVKLKGIIVEYAKNLSLNRSTLSTNMQTLAEEGNFLAKMHNIVVTKLQYIYTNLKALITDKDTVSTYSNMSASVLRTVAMYDEVAAEKLSTIVKEKGLAIKIYDIASTIKETVVKIASTSVNYLKAGAEGVVNFVKAIGTLITNKKTIAELAEHDVTLMKIGAIFGVRSAQETLNLIESNSLAIKIYKIAATIKETASNIAGNIVRYGTLAVETLINTVKNIGILITNSKTVAELAETDMVLYGGFAKLGSAAAQERLNLIESNSLAIKLYKIAVEVKDTIIINLNSVSKVKDTVITAKNTLVNNLNSLAKQWSTYVKLTSAEATVTETITEEGNIFVNLKNTITLAANTIARKLKEINTYLDSISVDMNSLSVEINTGSIISNTLASIANAMADILKIAKRIILIGITFTLVIIEGILTSELIAQAAAFVILTAPIWLVVGAIIGLIAIIEKVGEAFGWWSDLGSMFSAIWSGIMRIWDALMNSKPMQSIRNFVYTIQKLFEGIVSVLQGFWTLLFGEGENKSWDIVGDIINFLSIIADAFYLISGLWVIFTIFDNIGSAIGKLIDAWNLFWDSALSNELLTTLGEAFSALVEPFQEIWDAFSEIGDAFKDIWVAIFGEGEESKKEFNVFIEIIKAFAQFIINYVVPAIKLIAVAIKVILTPITILARMIQIVVGAFSGLFSGDWSVLTNGIMAVVNVFKPFYEMIKWIVDSASGIWEFITGSKVDGKGNENTNKENNSDSKNSNLLKKRNTPKYIQSQQNLQRKKVGSKLGSNYNQSTTSNSTIINNNYGKGSIPIDARNMTQKEAAKTIQTGLGGYSNYRKVVNK